MARPRSEAQKAASRAFMQKWAPATQFDPGWVEDHRLADLHPAGQLLYDAALDVVLRYGATFEGIDARPWVIGVIMAQGRGTAIQIGCEISRPADRLRRVVAHGRL